MQNPIPQKINIAIFEVFQNFREEWINIFIISGISSACL